MSAGEALLFVHATAVLVGECGVLIEGPSGSGKSLLGAALIDGAKARGHYGHLVGDDRVGLLAVHGRLVARPHPAVAGVLEQRGLGLLRVDHAAAGLVHLVTRLATDPAQLGPRLPDLPATLTLCGVTLPLLCLPATAAAADNARRVTAALRLFGRAGPQSQ